MELQLTQVEANRLILELKQLSQKVNDTVTDGYHGKIPVKSLTEHRKFMIAYFYEEHNVHINFYDLKTGLSLVRLNLNQSFHRNADGTKVSGNRVNIFSEEEFNAKNDGKTHMRAYPLPYKGLANTSDFLEALSNLLNYTNTDYTGKLMLKLDQSLNV